MKECIAYINLGDPGSTPGCLPTKKFKDIILTFLKDFKDMPTSRSWLTWLKHSLLYSVTSLLPRKVQRDGVPGSQLYSQDSKKWKKSRSKVDTQSITLFKILLKIAESIVRKNNSHKFTVLITVGQCYQHRGKARLSSGITVCRSYHSAPTYRTYIGD